MMGQHIEPETWHQLARIDEKQLKDFMANYRAQVAQVVNALPAHGDFVKQYAGASPDAWAKSVSG
jgi:hypothetical protein